MKTIVRCVLFFFTQLPALTLGAEIIQDVSTLVAAMRDSAEGSTIELAAGVFGLQAPLEIKDRMTIRRAGIGKTIITNHAEWKPSTRTLPDPEMTLDGLDVDAYLINAPLRCWELA